MPVCKIWLAPGLGQLTIVDDDLVEITNIHRQVLHHEADVGRGKVDSARDTLLAINTQCRINTIASRLDDNALLEQIAGHDVVVDCSDNLQTRNQLNQLCWQQAKPLVSGAAIRQEGQVISFTKSDKLPCYHCFSSLFGEQSLSCSEAGVLPPVVNVVGSMQAMETIKIVLDMPTFKPGILHMLDFASFQWRNFSVQKQPNCEVCGAS